VIRSFIFESLCFQSAKGDKISLFYGQTFLKLIVQLL